MSKNDFVYERGLISWNDVVKNDEYRRIFANSQTTCFGKTRQDYMKELQLDEVTFGGIVNCFEDVTLKKHISRATGVMQYYDHLGDGTGQPQFWLSEICKQVFNTVVGKDKHSVDILLEMFEETIRREGEQYSYLMVQRNSIVKPGSKIGGEEVARFLVGLYGRKGYVEMLGAGGDEFIYMRKDLNPDVMEIAGGRAVAWRKRVRRTRRVAKSAKKRSGKRVVRKSRRRSRTRTMRRRGNKKFFKRRMTRRR